MTTTNTSGKLSPSLAQNSTFETSSQLPTHRNDHGTDNLKQPSVSNHDGSNLGVAMGSVG